MDSPVFVRPAGNGPKGETGTTVKNQKTGGFLRPEGALIPPPQDADQHRMGVEVHTGRIDCRVQTKDYIYLFEFKRDDTATAALRQIDSKEYALPFSADSRKLYKIGVSFDSATRKLAGWEVAE